MTWRSGSKLFIEIWPLIQENIPDREHRINFTGYLIERLVHDDMDPYDIEDVHPDVREAMRKVGIEISDPDAYDQE
ncbi:MAG: hypothetical protein MUC83_01620 [Pirellula sp.]|jgi:hypothetical protein|nr:hypothetical protein [Pirellula sp.]